MPAPAFGAKIGANFHHLINFRIGEDLALALIPSHACKRTPILAELLFAIQAETVLDAPLLAAGNDIGLRASESNRIAVKIQAVPLMPRACIKLCRISTAAMRSTA